MERIEVTPILIYVIGASVQPELSIVTGAFPHSPDSGDSGRYGAILLPFEHCRDTRRDDVPAIWP
jgi:hypothetical protein